jgi:2-polyprenyl-3-methyl-5-hydroxy-6-metoxy-1,4-benzoquinol methylase
MRKDFVSKEIECWKNESALEKLKIKNDKKFLLNSDEGIVEVSKERWEEAQYYEKKTWDKHEHISDMPNRNIEHVLDFDNYKTLNDVLTNKDLSIIELGCGPFTQITHILRRINYNSVKLDLLDPLVDHYSKLNNCVYKGGELIGFENVEINLINSPIEEYNLNKKYDIIVMMNVLEHCFNVAEIFEKINNMLKENTIFIFSDCCIKNSMMNDLVESQYDSGHPIRITEKKLDEYLSLYNNRIYYKEFHDRHNQEWRIDKYCIFKI